MHASVIFELVDRFVVRGCVSKKKGYFDRLIVNSCATPSYQSADRVELMRFQPKQVSLFFLGEPYRKGNDSCCVFILDMHILYCMN